MTKLESQTQRVCARVSSGDDESESVSDSVLLPPAPDASVTVEIPRMQPIGKIRHYDAALGLWAQDAVAPTARLAPHATDSEAPEQTVRFDSDEAPTIPARGAQRDDPASVTLSSRPRPAPARRSRAA